ncbi:hypothetical protein GHT06_013804 [Daphnia sinensis]|uniref:PKD domain-containing protein n=1 Tax=Daphnia sinensis TaxID=1820382 RepID=A0AAD5KSQ9_9CRUS|nr:hypothetical protein GHT06_013804 [Daphnia sinensis]
MQSVVLAALIAVAAANSVYTGPASSNSDEYNAPSSSRSTYEVKQYPAQPYSFNWAVYDGYGNDYSHSESSNSYVTTGTYRVLLPDGRVQIVTYKADDYGYNADVKYEGEAKYPAAASYSAPAYSAPVFTSRPAVTAPAVSSGTYSTPMFISRPAVTATAGNSRTYSGQVVTSPAVTAPFVTSPAITGPVVTAPDANSRSYSGQVFTSPAVPAPAVFISRPSIAPASTSRTYSTPIFTSAVTATGRPAQPSTAPATGPVYTTSGNVARDY